MGRLIIPKKTRDYLFIASGTGLSPNINRLKFYDSGLIQLGKPIYYDETNTYKLRWSSGLWVLSRIDDATGYFMRIDSSILGDYIAQSGWSGTLIISEYKNKISIKKQNLGGGKLNLNKKYLYKATGTGLSPNINGLRFYDSGLSFYTNKIFYDETNTYAMWINSTGNYWTIGLIAQAGTLPGNNVFYKAYSNSGEPPTGTYTAASGWTGTVIISEI